MSSSGWGKKLKFIVVGWCVVDRCWIRLKMYWCG